MKLRILVLAFVPALCSLSRESSAQIVAPPRRDSTSAIKESPSRAAISDRGNFPKAESDPLWLSVRTLSEEQDRAARKPEDVAKLNPEAAAALRTTVFGPKVAGANVEKFVCVRKNFCAASVVYTRAELFSPFDNEAFAGSKNVRKTWTGSNGRTALLRRADGRFTTVWYYYSPSPSKL